MWGVYLGGRQKVNITIARRVSQKVIWPPMALRIGLLRSSALQNDGLDVPVILQCRTPQETNPKGHWGPNYFLRNSPLNGDVDLLAGSQYQQADQHHKQADLLGDRYFYSTTDGPDFPEAESCL